jgi:uncharacterized protein YndB with AHSA1/START domain
MSDDRTLVLTRVLNAPREMVFAAWTDPAQAAQWWGPRGCTTAWNEMDVRVGGTWRRSMYSTEGTEHRSRGVYREIVEPERLVFTFSWEKGGAAGHGPETLITLAFTDLGDGRTELTLRQEVFETVVACEEHRAGWSSCLDRFADYLAERRSR